MFLYIQVIGYSILLHANLCTSISNNLEISKTCPTWTYPSPPHNECVCGNAPGISCDQDTLTVSVRAGRNICMFFSDNLQTILIGTCPYMFNGQIPRNTSQIMEEISKLCLRSPASNRSTLWRVCGKLHSSSLFLQPWLHQM